VEKSIYNELKTCTEKRLFICLYMLHLILKLLIPVEESIPAYKPVEILIKIMISHGWLGYEWVLWEKVGG